MTVYMFVDLVSLRTETVVEHNDGNHIHRYADTATGQTWTWCERCQCFVNSKCDHRTRFCGGKKA